MSIENLIKLYGINEYKIFHRQYSLAMRRAKERNIPWEFTFESWIEIWLDSGKWKQRGSGRGKFNMCRNDDIGPYSPTNVRIDTHENNLIERNKTRPNDGGKKHKGRNNYWIKSGIQSPLIRIKYIRKDDCNNIQEYFGNKELKKQGYNPSNIKRCMKSTNYAYGYKWEIKQI